MSRAQPPMHLLEITECISLPGSVYSEGEMGDAVGKRILEDTDIEGGNYRVRTQQW